MSVKGEDRWLPALGICEYSSDGLHQIYPSAQHPRFILPVCRPGQALALRFFQPSVKARTALRVRALGFASSKVGFTAAMCQLIGIGSKSAKFTALSIGTPGPYSKFTILHCDNKWKPKFISKLGVTVAAQGLVANEGRTLEALASIASLAGNVPSLLRVVSAPGSRCIRQSIAIGGQWRPLDASEQIVEMLRALAANTGTYCELGNSNVFHVLQARARLLMGTVSTRWSQRIHKVCAWMESHARRTGFFVRAHRDFVHWNIKDIGGIPFVYDWEYSMDGYPAGYDILHFMLMPYASRGSIKRSSVAAAVSAAKHVNTSACELEPLEQLLLYVFDVSTFYLESNDGREEGDKVVASYGELIDRLLGDMML